MGTPVFVSVRSATSTTSSSGITCVYPASVNAGDLLLLLLRTDSINSIVRSNSELADWFLIAESSRGSGSSSTTTHLSLFYKIAVGTEGGTTFLARNEGSGNQQEARMLQYRGVDPVYPFGTCTVTNGGAGLSTSLPSAKVQLDGSLAVAMMSMPNTTAITLTPASGYTEQYENTTSWSTFNISDKPVDAAGVVSGTMTPSAVVTAWASIVLILNPDTANTIQSTAWMYPSNAVNNGSSGSVWSSPANAISSDNSRATVSKTGSGGFDSRGLLTSGHGFSIPDGSIIVGLEVQYEGRAYHDLLATLYQVHPSIFLARAGAIEAAFLWNKVGRRFTTSRQTSPTSTVPADQTFSWGGPGHTWELDLSVADVNNSGFGMALVVTNPVYDSPTSTPTLTFQIDALAMRVFYFPGSSQNRLFPTPI